MDGHAHAATCANMRVQEHICGYMHMSKSLCACIHLQNGAKNVKKFGASLAVNKPLTSSQLNNIGSHETALLHIFLKFSHKRLSLVGLGECQSIFGESFIFVNW